MSCVGSSRKRRSADPEPKPRTSYLVFDTETTGLPDTPCFGHYYPPTTHVHAYAESRVVQIAWQLIELQTHRVIRECSFIVSPDNWEVPPGAQAVHGISTEMAARTGTPLPLVLAAFRLDLNQAGAIVAHNLGFDLHVLSAELVRLDAARWVSVMNRLTGLPRICTMKSSTELCGLWTSWGKVKPPRLTELYAHLFDGATFPSAHDALGDVRATSKALVELVRRQVIAPLTNKDKPSCGRSSSESPVDRCCMPKDAGYLHRKKKRSRDAPFTTPSPISMPQFQLTSDGNNMASSAPAAHAPACTELQKVCA
jgi:DNA polymerase III epsilon subunit-like protein